MTKKLPIAIVIPHASSEVPPEIQGRIALSEAQIFNEADAFTDSIYDYREQVLHWLSFPYARALIDVNRSLDNWDNREGDGIVKRKSSYGDTVYLEGQEPDAALEQQLIEKYWQDWHNQLAAISADKEVKLVLDCHSMAAIGPSAYDDPLNIRPRVSASNMGDKDGDPREGDFITASPSLTKELGAQLGSVLEDIPALGPVAENFLVNSPFRGGWNIRMHGGKQQTWIMIELSRGLYIKGEQHGSTPVVAPDKDRISLLRERIWKAIEDTVTN